MSDYDMTDSDQMFLQFMMIKKWCSCADVWKIFRKCNNVPDDELDIPTTQMEGTQLVDLVKKVNNNIKPMYMEIKKCVSEDNGTQYYVLVNTSDNAISKVASEFKVVELEYFKKIVEAIVLNDNGSETSRNLLNITNEMEHKLSKNDAQDFLENLTEKFWLNEKRGEYSLSPRCIIELEPYLKSVFLDISNCLACRTIIIKGQSCDSCDGKYHFHCARQYFKKKGFKECIRCKAEWTKNNENEDPKKVARNR